MTWLAHPVLPLVVLAALTLWALGLVALVLLSPTLPGLARAVLALCGYDPVSGAVRADGLASLLVQTYLFAGLIAWLYTDDVHRLWGQYRWVRRLALAGLAAPLAGFVAALLAGRAVLALPDGPPQVRAPLLLPDVELIDQRGMALHTSALRGRVVLLTFFYAECTESCPLLVQRMQTVLQRFPDDGVGSELVALAVSLDPERDAPPALAAAAERWRVVDARLHLVTGAPGAVRQVLDAATLWHRARGGGGWDHANLVLVLDRAGREAFVEQGVTPDPDRLSDAVARLLRS